MKEAISCLVFPQKKLRDQPLLAADLRPLLPIWDPHHRSEVSCHPAITPPLSHVAIIPWQKPKSGLGHL